VSYSLSILVVSSLVAVDVNVSVSALLYFLQCFGAIRCLGNRNAIQAVKYLLSYQCFDAVGWAAGRASGL